MAISLNEIVYDIRNTVSSGITSDDFGISKRQVAYWVKGYRSVLVHNEISTRYKIHDAFVQHIPLVELERVDASEVCEIPLGCYVLRSKLEIPKTIYRHGRNTILSVTSLDGQQHYSETTYFRKQFNRYNKFTAGKPRWYIKGNYLYIESENQMQKGVTISGIFEDPIEAATFYTCADQSCYDWDSPYPITKEMATKISSLIISEKLGVALQTVNDTSNNAQDNTQGQTQ